MGVSVTKGPICDACECVNWCSRHGCLPITMEEDKPSMLANKWLWLSAVAAGLAWALVGWFVK